MLKKLESENSAAVVLVSGNTIILIMNPGFWPGISNLCVITGTVLFYKRVDNLNWSDLGPGRPENWWKPLLVTAGTSGAIVLFSKFIMPFIMEPGPHSSDKHPLLPGRPWKNDIV